MLKNNEGRPEGSGFVVFTTHTDARGAMASLNGRSMEGRAVQVVCSSDREFDLTRPFRFPFPTVQEVANTMTPAPDTKPGDWFCTTCQFHNFANRVLCKNCNNPPSANSRPGGGGAALFSQSPPQGQYGYHQQPAQHHHTHHAGGMKPGDWICTNSSCRFQNFQSRNECMKCRSPRPAGGIGGGGVGIPPSAIAPGGGVVATAVGITSFKPGDWVCAGCQKHNFASRAVCMQCGRGNDLSGVLVPPPGAGMGQQQLQVMAPPGVGGGVGAGATAWRATDRPGDWTCPQASCRYHNYASRMECFRCGSRK
ncbi:hypothetical protein HDU98_005944, partial [Podochytrium sp. JEL0797]